MSEEQETIKATLPAFEGMATLENIETWFSEVLKTLQSTADATNSSGSITMTIKIIAYPQKGESE